MALDKALIYAPIVYVDSEQKDPSKEYQFRGLTLITISVSQHGPMASRVVNLVIPKTEIPFGGFAALYGYQAADPHDGSVSNRRDLYLFGIASNGMQLAKVDIENAEDYSQYSFYNPRLVDFVTTAPNLDLSSAAELYLAGSFSSGNVFYSCYFHTYILLYLNTFADSTVSLICSIKNHKPSHTVQLTYY